MPDIKFATADVSAMKLGTTNVIESHARHDRGMAGRVCTDVLYEPFDSMAAWGGSGSSIVAGRTGTACQLTGGGTATYTLAGGVQSYYATCGFAYQVSSVGTASRPICSFRDSTAQYFTTLRIEINGALGFYAGDSTGLLGTSAAGLIAAATWYYLEVQVFVANAGGYFTVRAQRDDGHLRKRDRHAGTDDPGEPDLFVVAPQHLRANLQVRRPVPVNRRRMRVQGRPPGGISSDRQFQHRNRD